jgi:trans-aconitate methyltransferase
LSALWSQPDYARHWDEEARDPQANPVRAAHLDLLLDVLAEVSQGWCLDLGCGSGLVAERALDRYPDLKVFGVDGSSPMLEMAAKRLARFGDRVHLVQADLSKSFEGVAPEVPSCTAAVAVQALHHLDRAQLGLLMRWVFQRLSPGGLLAVIDPVLIESPVLYPSFRLVKALLSKRSNPDTYDEYRLRLLERGDRPLPLDDYLTVLRESGFAVACLDKRADRAFLIGRRS